MRKWMILGMLAAMAFVDNGCSSTLETGYVPRKLSATDGERRAYYAEKYSPDARPAQPDVSQDVAAHRNGAY